MNGELSEAFKAGRGLRQGVPLSLYLFVLCMEKLSHLITSTVEIKQWKPIKVSQANPFISHIFFADDLMLFSEASRSQARILKKYLDKFCNVSGQMVSFEKSSLYCSPNTKKRTVRKIVKICGSPSTDNLGKYLGMSLFHSRITKYTYANIVDKVQNRLSGWKSKCLSMASRLTPIYAM